MDKNEQSKNIILEQGFETFLKDGVKFFTVETLATNLRMSKKTIYKYFPTKEKLIEKIVGYFTGSVKHKFQSVVKSDENPVIKFTMVMDFLMKKIGYLKMENAMELKIRYPQVWKKIENFRLELTQYIADIFKEAQNKGLAKADVDMEKVAIVYMNIVNNTFQPEFFLENNLAPVDTIRLFVKMITEGLFTQDGVAVMIESSNVNNSNI